MTMRTLFVVTALLLAPPAAAQKSGGIVAKKTTEKDKRRRAVRGKVDFKEQTYKLKKLLQLIGELTRKNFLISDKLKNKEVTIYCQKPVSIAEAYRVFISALAANKMTLVKVGAFYRVVSTKDAIRGPSPTFLDGAHQVPFDERMVTVIHKLEHVDGTLIQKAIKSLVSSSGKLEVLPPKMLLLSDSALNVRRLMRIIKHLDTQGASQRIHFYQAKYADASDLASKLKEVFIVQAKSAKKPRASSKKKDAGSTAPTEVVLDRVVADERTNKLIIVAGEGAFKRAKDLLERLDLPTPDDEGAVHVLRLENADAKELSSTLSSLISGMSKGRKGRKGKKGSAKKGAATSGKVNDLFVGEVKVTADEATNSLVVVASRNDLVVLNRIIEKLDYRRPQVFVEAAFLELSVKKGDEFGAGLHSGLTFDGSDWVDPEKSPWVAGALAGGAGVLGSTPNSGLRSLSPASAAGLLGLVGTFQGISIPGLDEALGIKLPTFGVVFQALQSTNGVDVLSTPHILTTDNEEAEIVVGQNVPFASSMSGGLSSLAGLAGAQGSSAASALGGFGFPSVSIQRQDVALKFKFTPHVTNTGHVRMELEAEISELGGIEPTTKSPITTQRKIKTTVEAVDSQTIVIGGLIADRKTESASRVPLLGSLPLIGHLFRSSKIDTEKTNLLLVITPHIVRSEADFVRIFRRKMAERQEYVAMVRSKRKDYKAPINWQRKNGAFAQLDHDLGKYLSRRENGGLGNGEEQVIGVDTAEKPVATEAEPAPEASAAGEAKPTEEPTSPPPAAKKKPAEPAPKGS
jgi:general secretion pathway protein D